MHAVGGVDVSAKDGAITFLYKIYLIYNISDCTNFVAEKEKKMFFFFSKIEHDP